MHLDSASLITFIEIL